MMDVMDGSTGEKYCDPKTLDRATYLLQSTKLIMLTMRTIFGVLTSKLHHNITYSVHYIFNFQFTLLATCIVSYIYILIQQRRVESTKRSTIIYDKKRRKKDNKHNNVVETVVNEFRIINTNVRMSDAISPI